MTADKMVGRAAIDKFNRLTPDQQKLACSRPMVDGHQQRRHAHLAWPGTSGNPKS